MNKSLRTYLEWRFRINNVNRYQFYRDEWIDNIPESQLWYYEIEKKHLSDRGIYNL